MNSYRYLLTFLIFIHFSCLLTAAENIISLEEIVQLAVKNNPRIKANSLNLPIADNNLAIAKWGYYFPKIEISTKAWKYFNQTGIVTHSKEKQEQGPNLKTSFNIYYPIFQGGAGDAKLEKANIEKKISLLQNQKFKNQYINQVKKSYWGYFKEKISQDILTEEHNTLEPLFKKAKTRFKQGMINLLDYQRIEFAYLQSKSQLTALEVTLKNYEDYFERITTISFERKKITLPKNGGFSRNEKELINYLNKGDKRKTLSALTKSYRSRSVEEHLSKHQVYNSGLDLKIAKSKFFPSLMIGIEHSYLHSREKNKGLENTDESSLYINLTIPLFDSYQKFSSLKNSNIQKLQQEYQRDEGLKQNIIALSESYYNLLSQIKSLPYQQRKARLAKSIANNSINKFNLGLEASHQVIEDLSTQREEQIKLLQIIYKIKISLESIRFKLGWPNQSLIKIVGPV